MPDQPSTQPIDISGRVRRAVWYAAFMPFVAPTALPPIVAWNVEGSKMRDQGAPITESVPIVEQQPDLPLSVNRIIVGCTVLQGGATGSYWLDDGASNWLAGWSPVASESSGETAQIYSSTMRTGPIGQSLSYIGSTGLVPCVTVATNKRVLLRGPAHWEGAIISADIVYHPPVENVGIVSEEKSGGRNQFPTLVSSGGPNSSSDYGNYLSMWFGNTEGAPSKGNRYCLMFKLPTWEPELWCHRGEEPPATGDVPHPVYNEQTAGWEKLRHYGQMREHFDFETARIREIHYELRIVGNQMHMVIQPLSRGVDGARFVWNIDESQEQKETAFDAGIAKESSTDNQSKPSGIPLHEKIMPPGRMFFDCSGAEQLSFVLRAEIPTKTTPQTKEVVFDHSVSWNILKQVATVSDNGDLSDDDVKNAIKAAITSIRFHPDHAGSSLVTAPTIDEVSINVVRPANSDLCQIRTKLTIKAGTKRPAGSGPIIYWYPTISGARGIVDPNVVGTGLSLADYIGSYIYLLDGKSWQYSADAMNRERLSLVLPASDGFGTIAVSDQSPSMGAWTNANDTMKPEQARGTPLRMVAGYTFLGDEGQVYRWWPVCTVYNEKTTLNFQAGTQYGTPSYQARMDNTGRVALLQKAKAFDLPAADGYSHLWMMRLLAHYCGIDDSEMAPWRVPIYGRYGKSTSKKPYSVAGWDTKVSMAMATKMFAPQENALLASWDYPCPGNYDNTGGKNATWRFKIEPGGSVFNMMQTIAQAFSFMLYFDNLGRLHYEPEIFTLLCSGEFLGIDAQARGDIIQHLAKGEFCSLGHFSYSNSIMSIEAVRLMLGRHDGVMVVGETPFPTCVCDRTGCNQVGTTDAGGLYHYIRYGGSQSWNASNKIFSFRKVETTHPTNPNDADADSYTNMSNRNPMNNKNWLYVSSPNITNMQILSDHALYLQQWCRQWWIGDTYQLLLAGQPHIYPGDFLSVEFMPGVLKYFYVKASNSGVTNGKFVTSAVGILLPPGIAIPPSQASELGWAGHKPDDTGAL